MANFTSIAATRTITSTEYSLALDAAYSSGSPKTTQGYVQAFVDRAAMVAGDAYTLTVYKRCNAGTFRILLQATIPPHTELYATPLMLLGDGWDITLKLSTGTARSMLFEVVQDTNDVNVASVAASAITAAAIATDAITAAKVATDAVTEIQAGLATAAAVTTAQTDLTTLTGRLTATRAGLLDNLDAAITTRASASALATTQADTDDIQTRLTTLQADTDNIQTRLPAALVNGLIGADVGSWLGTTVPTPPLAGYPNVVVGLVLASALGANSIANGAITAAKFDTNAIDSNALASSAVTEIQSGLATAAAIAALPTLAAITAVIPTAVAIRDSILDYALRTGRTVRGHLRRVDALLFGQATGLLGALATLYRPGGAVAEYTATQNTAAGTRTEVDCTGSEVP